MIVKIKGLAGSYVWCPQIDSIESKRLETVPLSSQWNSPLVPPFHPCEWMTLPCTYILYWFMYQGQMFLTMIDSNTKWIQVFPVKASILTTLLRVLWSLVYCIKLLMASVLKSRILRVFLRVLIMSKYCHTIHLLTDWPGNFQKYFFVEKWKFLPLFLI